MSIQYFLLCRLALIYTVALGHHAISSLAGKDNSLIALQCFTHFLSFTDYGVLPGLVAGFIAATSKTVIKVSQHKLNVMDSSLRSVPKSICNFSPVVTCHFKAQPFFFKCLLPMRSEEIVLSSLYCGACCFSTMDRSPQTEAHWQGKPAAGSTPSPALRTCLCRAKTPSDGCART